MAEKLDRLAARLQQISTAPDHGAPLQNPHGIDDGYDHDDIDYDDRGPYQQTTHHDDLGDYAESLDSGRAHDARGGWNDQSESPVARPCRAMTPPPASEHPEPRRGSMPEPQAQQAETDRGRVLDAIVKTLDSLDARIRNTEARMEENLRSEQTQHEFDRMEQGNREREARERQTEIDLYNACAVQRERRQGSRRSLDRVPTAREIGHAVADMRSDAAALAPRAKPSDPAHPRPVFARAEGDRPAPSSDRTPRRRPFDWNPQAKTGRRIDYQTFQEIQAELTAMRANMGAPGLRAPEPSDDLPTRIESDAFEPQVDQGWQSPAQRSEAERSQIDAEAFERLAHRIDRSLEEFDLPALHDLRSELAEIHAAVNDDSASASPRSLQADYSKILDRLEALRRESDDLRLAHRLEARVDDMARVIEAIPQIQHLSVLERRLTSLSSRFDSIAGMLDPQGHAAVEAELDSLRDSLQSLGFRELINRLEIRLADLSDKITRLESARSSEMAQLDASLNQLTQELPHISIIARSTQILNHKMNDFADRLASMALQNLGSIEDRLVRLEDSAQFIGEAVTQNTTEARLSQMGDMLHEIGSNMHDGGGTSETTGRIESALYAIDAAVRSEPSAGQFQGLHTRIDLLQGTMMNALDAAIRRTPSSAQLESLRSRVDSLHEAVTESTSNPQGLMAAYSNSPRQGQLEEIQNTLNQMVITLGIEPRQDMIDRPETQIGRLGNRAEGLTDIDILTRMEAAIRKLSSIPESGIHFEKLVQVEHRLEGIVDRFDILTQRLADVNLSRIQEEVAQLRSLLQHPASIEDIFRNEIAVLAERIDGFQVTDQSSPQLAALEHQIMGLAGRLGGLGPISVDLSPIEGRLIEIERHLASQSSDAVELARSAARDAVRGVALEMAAQQDSDTGIDPALTELRDQIEALKAAEARDRSLHQEALVAISNSVGQILARLDRLDEISQQLSERLLLEVLAPSTALSPAATPSSEADWDPMPRHEASMSSLDVGQCSDRPKPDEDDDDTPAMPGATGFLDTSDHDNQGHPSSAHPDAFDDRVHEELPQSQVEYGFGGDETPEERPALRQSQAVGQPDRSLPPAIEHDLEADVSSAPKRELISDPRARLFGNPSDQPAPEPAPKRGLLRSREKRGVEDDSQSINAATMLAATAAERAHLKTRQPLEFDMPETGSDHEKFSLDHNPRPDWNTLSDEFQPLRPGTWRPDMGPEENTDADFNSHGQLDFDRSDTGKQNGFGEQQIADSNASLLSRVGRVMDKKSDSIAMVAGAVWKRQRCCPTTPQPDSRQPHRISSPNTTMPRISKNR